MFVCNRILQRCKKQWLVSFVCTFLPRKHEQLPLINCRFNEVYLLFKYFILDVWSSSRVSLLNILMCLYLYQRRVLYLVLSENWWNFNRRCFCYGLGAGETVLRQLSPTVKIKSVYFHIILQ